MIGDCPSGLLERTCAVIELL
jgi:IclR family acetate operon transcriptional repressor